MAILNNLQVILVSFVLIFVKLVINHLLLARLALPELFYLKKHMNVNVMILAIHAMAKLIVIA